MALVLAVGAGSPNHDPRWAPTDPRTVRRDLRSSGDVFLVELTRDWRREVRGKVGLFSLSVVVRGARAPTLPPRLTDFWPLYDFQGYLVGPRDHWLCMTSQVLQ